MGEGVGVSEAAAVVGAAVAVASYDERRIEGATLTAPAKMTTAATPTHLRRIWSLDSLMSSTRGHAERGCTYHGCTWACPAGKRSDGCRADEERHALDVGNRDLRETHAVIESRRLGVGRHHADVDGRNSLCRKSR